MSFEVILHGSELNDGMGEPPIMVSENAFCDECNREHEFEKCPKCGSFRPSRRRGDLNSGRDPADG